MWKRLCACRNARGKSGRPSGARSLSSRIRSLFPVLPLALALCLGARPARADQLITRIFLNQEDKGDLFVDHAADGDFLLKSEDLKSIGFRTPLGQVTRIGSDEYRSLRSISGVSFSFNEGDLTLSISAPPALLGKETVDFSSPPTQKVYYPEDSSVFLNYGADYLNGSGFSSSSISLSEEIGARTGNLLFLSDSLYTKDQVQDRLVRLQTSFSYDDRPQLRRLVAGDFFATSGDLGSSLNMGGISLAKVYRIDPYFVNYPTLGIAGQVSTPSEAKVYLNGVLMKTQTFSPGEFELKNITPYGTAGNLEVVLKDAFGREQRLSYPFYFAGASLLKQGLQEYSYNLGFLREAYGAESNRYSEPAFSAFHRYGVSDALTLGFRAEAGNGLANLGPQATVLLDHAGLLNLSLAGSAGGSSQTGTAATASYLYQGLQAGASLSLTGYSRDYATVASNPALQPKSIASGSLTYTDKLLGSLSVGYSSSKMYLGQDSTVASVGYSRVLPGGVSFTATYRNVKQEEPSNEIFLTLNYTPRPDLSVSASYQSASGTNNALLEVQKNPPVGEGYGYRASLGRSDTAGQASTTVNPWLQYNGRHGIYQAEVNAQLGSGQSAEQYHLNAAGALVYAGHTFGATRPVYDSFALVKVGDLEGIKVLLNSQEVGSTDSSGKLFIPELGSFYQNQVAIDTSQVSIDYFLSSVAKVVSPPLRSGSCIPFIAKKLQPISGTLKVREAGALKPLEFQEVTLVIAGKSIVFPTGTGGAFDLDLSQSDEFKKLSDSEEIGCDSFVAGPSLFIKPGTYRGTVDYSGKSRSFSLTIPDSREPTIDLGVIIVDILPEAKPREGKAPAPPEPPAQAAPKAIRQPAPPPLAPPDPAKQLPDDLPIMEVNFRFGTAELASGDDYAILTTALRLLELFPYARLVIEGYADQMGSQEFNLVLSQKRALAVAEALRKLGGPAEKIARINWFGKRTLLCDSLEEHCREQNRRVVIQLIAGPENLAP